jgi:cell wall-associated NlpC family hydrolase
MLGLVIGTLSVGAVCLLAIPVLVAGSTAASADTNPTAAGASCVVTSTGSATAVSAAGVSLSAEQTHNAQIIVAVVAARGLPGRAAEIALMTAMQESSLTVVDHGDAAGPDSRGLFQQRASWGPYNVRMDPAGSTGLFLDALVKVTGWQDMDPAHAAHLVQRNQRESDYVRWIPFSRALAAALIGHNASQVGCTGGTLPPGATADARVKTALAAAASMLGKPYCFDGGDANGPTHGQGGSGCPDGTVGFDCSGLTLYAWARAGIELPHFSGDQYNRGRHIPITQVQPGDLIFLANASEGNHHVAMIWSIDPGSTTGSGQIIEAQDYNVPVHLRRWTGVSEPEVLPLAVRLSG